MRVLNRCTPCRQRTFDLISQKRCKIGCKLVLFTTRKSHTGLRLVLKLVTLNDLKPRNGRYFALFHSKSSFQSQVVNYVKLTTARPTISVTKMLPKTLVFGPV